MLAKSSGRYLSTPQSCADAEREDEAEHIERAPGAHPGHCENHRVEHGVIAEQYDVIALIARGQYRREKAGKNGENGQSKCILRNCQHTGAGHDDDEQRERHRRRQQSVGVERAIHRDDENADRAALQTQRERTMRFALTPCEAERGQCRQRDAGETDLDRHAQPTRIGGVLE